MNKTFGFMILGLLVLSMIGMASAQAYVLGKIYNSDYTETIADANVIVTCYKGDTYPVLTAVTNEYGDYVVNFESTTCSVGNTVRVDAEKEGIGSGSGEGVVDESNSISLNLAIINVTVPEFGLIVGALTILSAVGIFFFVRRE